PSAVVDPAFAWEDADWFGRPLCDYVLYELHVGTFTPEGTFDAIIPHLDGLRDLGVTAIELMPVAQFPGTRNWGYDGVYPFAVHALTDVSPRHFLAELAASVKRAAEGPPPRRVHLIAESDLNDPRVVRPPEVGGYGLDGQWNDDFHHALHVLLTGERAGYYANYGGLAPLARTYVEGFAYTGQYAPYHQRRHGAPAGDLPPGRLVVFAQNHDQVGNRF